MRIGLDATYSLGAHLTGVGVYSRRLLHGLLEGPQPDIPASWSWCYRPNRYLAALRDKLPAGVDRALIGLPPGPRCDLFHGLNQRLPALRARHTVVTFHDLFVLSGDYSTPDFRRRFAGQARDAAARASLVIAVSQFTAGQLSSLLSVDASRIRVIGHGTDMPELDGGVERDPVILTVGSVQTRKNTLRLIHAFEQLPPEADHWRLVLAGGGGHGSEAIAARIASSPRRAAIEWTGWIPEERLREHYRRASIFAFPSLDEGFGIPVLEAMSWQLPIVTSNCSALPEVSAGIGVEVSPFSVDDISHALLQLIRDPALRTVLGLRGREHAAKHSWTAAAEATWRVYRELLS